MTGQGLPIHFQEHLQVSVNMEHFIKGADDRNHKTGKLTLYIDSA